MAAATGSGSEKHWFNGLPYEGIQKSTNDEGSEKYWFNGLPGESLYPVSAYRRRLLVGG